MEVFKYPKLGICLGKIDHIFIGDKYDGCYNTLHRIPFNERLVAADVKNTDIRKIFILQGSSEITRASLTVALLPGLAHL